MLAGLAGGLDEVYGPVGAAPGDATVAALGWSSTAGQAVGQRNVYLPPAKQLADRTGFLSGPQAGAPETIATDYLKANAAQLGLTSGDWSHFRVTSQYTDAHNGVTHIYLQQTYRGLPIENTRAYVNVAADGSVINAGASFVPGLSGMQTLPVPAPSISAVEAYTRFADAFGLTMTSTPIATGIGSGAALKQSFSSGGVVSQPITAQLRYLATPSGVQLSWHFDVKMLDKGSWFYADVSAIDGSILQVIDTVANYGTYRVYAAPLESPQQGVRSLVTNPEDLVASPYGWHDVNGLPGAEFFDTRGNNVFVQEDRDGDAYNQNPLLGGVAAVGYRPSGGPGLIFDFPYNPAQQPIVNEDAAMTNYFYWVNLNHDVFFRYGFNEAAGNFQATNYTGMGWGNDPIIAYAQAPSPLGPFFTPTPDGIAPIMVMTDSLLFSPLQPARDASFASTIITHEYTHGVTSRLTGGPADFTSLSLAGQSAALAEGWSDFFPRMFVQKATDQPGDAFPEGTWFLGQPPDGPGVRIYPYSYDTSINPNTIGIYNLGNVDLYLAGHAWASALWDLNWLLREKYGFDSNLHTGQGGNNLAFQLAIDGLKLQPSNPSFTEARDAILSADLIMNKGVNHKEIWDAFARRGLGVTAWDGGAATAIRVIEGFDVPTNPGIVNGNVWNDLNGNGRRDAGEPGIANWPVFVDLDNDGIRDPLEPRTFTDAAGNYSFEFLAPGTFVIATETPSSTNRTYPAIPGGQTVNVVNNQVVDNVDFGFRPGALQSTGFKFNDLNGNGRHDEGEPGLGGMWIYVDYDGDGKLGLQEPKTKTAADGSYTLSIDRQGTFMVREVITPGWEQTYPGGADQGHWVTVESGALNVSLDFGNARLEDYSNAPSSFATGMHPIVPDFHLGVLNRVDDGVLFTSALSPGSTATVRVTTTVGANSPGRLNAWIDFNQNGRFDSNEKVFHDVRLTEGTHDLTFTVPQTAVPGLSQASFRYGYMRSLSVTADDFAGEVEDFEVRILGNVPDAMDDQFTVAQNSTSNRLNVLANDVPSRNGPISIVAVTTPNQGGQVLIVSGGTALNYTPRRGFFGTETFFYTIIDQAGITDTATVTVTVLPVFVNPIAVDDSFDVLENSVRNVFNVLANDFSGQRPPITIVQVLQPSVGTAEIDDRGTEDPRDDVILYTPDPGAGITDQFQYIIEDASGVQDTATVTVHIKPGADFDNLVQYRLETTDLSGNPIRSIGLGEPFLLRVYTQDLRIDDGDGDPADRRGVAAAFLDVLYDFRRVSVAGNIIFGPNYQVATSGSVQLPGVIDEAGAFQTGFDPLGADEVLVFAVPMTANATGLVTFVGDPADLTTDAVPPGVAPEHDTLLFQPPEVVGLQEIGYINTSLMIVSGDLPIAVDNTFSVAANSIANPLNVLANDIERTNPPLRVVGVGTPTQGGTVFIGPQGLDVRYTPPTGFQGTEQFVYTVENADGLTATARVTVQVGAAPKQVQIRLETTSLDGTPISTIATGGRFQVRMYVQDVRALPPDPSRMGVFAAYSDLLYNSNLVSTVTQPNNPFGFAITFGPQYQNGLSASDITPNLIDEVGAFQASFDPLGPGEFLLATITFDAHSAGIATFQTDPADISPLHDVLLYEPADQPVSLSAITLGSTSITIGTPIAEGELAYTNPVNPLDVNGDSNVTPIDALTVINVLNGQGPGKLPNVVIYAGEGERSSLFARKPNLGYIDSNKDGYVTPIDALLVINHLSTRNGAMAEGEFAAQPLSAAARNSEISTAAWAVLPHGTESDTRELLPQLLNPVQLSLSDNDPTSYLTARQSDSLWAGWSGDDSSADADVADDLAAAIASIWDDPSSIL